MSICCPHLTDDNVAALIERVSTEPWLMLALDAAAASGLPDAWIGAGVLRDVVWGQLNDGFDAAAVRDIDVAFYDPHDLSRRRDEVAEQQLAALAELPWEATNQAAVHTWYANHFGGSPIHFDASPIEPFASVHDAVATWPEIATCVAVRRVPSGYDVCAPYGLDDLLTGVWRRNPTRISVAASAGRLARQRVHERWPLVVIHDPRQSTSSDEQPTS